jgi:heme A synthase
MLHPPPLSSARHWALRLVILLCVLAAVGAMRLAMTGGQTFRVMVGAGIGCLAVVVALSALAQLGAAQTTSDPADFDDGPGAPAPAGDGEGLSTGRPGGAPKPR